MKSKPMTLKNGLTVFAIAILFAVASLGIFTIPNAKADDPVEPSVDPIFINLKNGDLDYDYDDPNMPKSNRLWKVTTDGNTIDLLNGVDIVYATKNDDGILSAVVGGDKDHPANDSFAAYTGKAITIGLNPDFEVNVQSTETVAGKTYKISELTDLTSSVTYKTVRQNAPEPGEGDAEPAFDNIGEQYALNALYTEVVLDFGDKVVLNQETNDVDVFANKLVIKKYWNIVTINNVLRSYVTGTGDENPFGKPVSGVELDYAASAAGLASPRPEHGDTVIWTIKKVSDDVEHENPVDEVISRFAVKFTVGEDAAITETIHAVDDENNVTADPIEGKTFGSYFENIEAVASTLYYLEGYVPEVTLAADETAWWDDSLGFTSGTKFAAYTQHLTIIVRPLDIADSAEFNVTVVGENKYNGATGVEPYENTAVMFRGNTLVRGVDYELSFGNNVNIGDEAVLIVTGMGNFTGTKEIKFSIAAADNVWSVAPNFVRWSFGSFNAKEDLFRAVPKFGEVTDVVYNIYTDGECTKKVENLPDGFKVNALGEVNDAVATELNKLARGRYYLVCTVKKTDNYGALESAPMVFNVFQASNAWSVTPNIKSWTEGGYDETENAIFVESTFGNDAVVVYVYNADNEVVYESKGGKVRTNELASLKSGLYTLTARVEETSDYSGLALYTINFQVFEKPGIPGWGIALIVIGVVAVIAIVILILFKAGVISLLTGKVMMKIKSQATVDATLAAIRANKRNEEAKQSVAEAKAREARAARRAAAAAERALPAEQKAAALEAKAKAQAERAEKLRAKAEAMQARAERMRERAQEQSTARPEEPAPTEPAPTAEAAATDNTETTTASED